MAVRDFRRITANLLLRTLEWKHLNITIVFSNSGYNSEENCDGHLAIMAPLWTQVKSFPAPHHRTCVVQHRSRARGLVGGVNMS